MDQVIVMASVTTRHPGRVAVGRPGSNDMIFSWSWFASTCPYVCADGQYDSCRENWFRVGSITVPTGWYLRSVCLYIDSSHSTTCSRSRISVKWD